MSFIHADHVFLHLGDLLFAKHDPKTKKQPESSKET
jgi:dTDP-glucose pyrophosphorylase